MKLPERVLIAGCGYIGSRAAELLSDLGCRVFGVRRSWATPLAGVTPVTLDLFEGDLEALPENLDAVVWAVSPTRDEAGYRRAYVDGPQRLLDHLSRRGDPTRRFILVSSTSVWHRTDGADVDEETPPSPADFRGRTILEGERVCAAGAPRAVALRFAGIYGPGRTWLLDRIASADAAPPLREIHGNRIWRDDGANAIVHVLTLDNPDPVYVVADDDPADLRDVYAWLAAQMGVRLPAPDPAFINRGGDKRCRNHRLRATGLRMEAPDFRAGYSRMLNRP